MKHIEITRIIEVETVNLKGEYLGVYSRWSDTPDEFKFSIMHELEYENTLNAVKNINDFKSAKSELDGHKSSVVIWMDEFVDTFVAEGRLDFDIEKYYWKPTKWAEKLPSEYDLYWFSGHDYYFAELDKTPISTPAILLLTESSGYNIAALIKKLETIDEINILDDSYVPGNGRQLTVSVALTLDEYKDKSFHDLNIINKYKLDECRTEKEF